MTAKASILAVQPPIPQKYLGRYRNKTGVYLIRQENTVIYIGISTNIYKTVMRLFQNQGALSHLDVNTLKFEIVLTSLRIPSVEAVLKRLFTPSFNRSPKKLKRPSVYEKNQNRRILEHYLEQSRFDTKVNNTQSIIGEQHTDSKP